MSCINTCLLPYTSFCHTLHKVFSTRSPLAAETKLCVGGRRSQHTFEPVLCQGTAPWGSVQVVPLLMRISESWSASRVVKALPMCLGWQRTMAGTLGLLPLKTVTCPISAVQVTGQEAVWPLDGAFISSLSPLRGGG